MTWPDAYIETAIGAATLSMLSATPSVKRLYFGSIDMAVDLALEEGTQGGQSMLNTLRAGVILHSLSSMAWSRPWMVSTRLSWMCPVWQH